MSMSFISDSIRIVVVDPDGQIRESQRYSEFLTAPAIGVQIAFCGGTLIDLLAQESYISADLELRQVLTGNPHADAMRIIGNLAEVLVVKYCNEYPEVNRALARYARLGVKRTNFLDNFIAIGTGSKVTQSRYPFHYQPQDTQRDIIWVDKNDTSKQLACLGGSENSVKPAGLQIKASHDGQYIIHSISDYCYPILYFDLNDDWHTTKNALKSVHENATLIHPDEILCEIKKVLKTYFRLVINIIEGEISIQEIIQQSMYEGDTTLLAGLAISDIVPDKSIIICT
jgi:hypothetical protein